MLTPLSTFRSIVSDRATRGKPPEIPRSFCDSLYAYTVANVPSQINPGYIWFISWSTLDTSGCIRMHLEKVQGTLTAVQRQLTGFRFLTPINSIQKCLCFIFLSQPDLLYLDNQLNQTYMYTLDCSYYTKSFSTLNELLDDILNSGMDPNYDILFNNKSTGETAWDLIGPEA